MGAWNVDFWGNDPGPDSRLGESVQAGSDDRALVGDVSPGSPAAKAGLKSGDVITQFNGQAIQDASQLKLRVAETAPGSKAPVIVSRNGEDKTFDVTLGNAPENKVARPMRPMGPGGKKLWQVSELPIWIKAPGPS